GVAVLASIIGIFFVRLTKSIMGALYKGLIAAGVLSLLGFGFIAQRFANAITAHTTMPLYSSGFNYLFYPMLLRVAVTGLIVLITEYYTSKSFRPVRSIANSSETGHGTNIITGLSVGMEATALPVLVIVAGILTAYSIAGLYGVALSTMSMLGMAG